MLVIVLTSDSLGSILFGNTMKVSLLINTFIGPRVQSGPGVEGYKLAMNLYEKGVLGKVYCYGVEKKSEIPSCIVVPFCTSRIVFLLLRILIRTTKRFPVLRGRRWVEKWMDCRYSMNLDQEEGDILYSPKPLYPRTFSKARRLGVRVLVETSVLHPRFNYDIVSRERKRLKLTGAAGYVDPVRVKYIEKALQEADVIFAWSSFVRESYIRYGVGEDKIRISAGVCEPPGVDLKKFHHEAHATNTRFTVLHLSSITVIKGVQYLIEAWNNIANRIDGDLVIVGAVDRDMRKIMGRYQCPNIKWIGPTADPVPYYQSASLYVSPSISDAGPRTVLESMACGVPAIVSDHCGISASIQHGKNGFVYHYNDVDRLAELIEWCFMNRDRVMSMGQAALDTVKGYSVTNYPEDVWARIKSIH
jgi:glycosyltransferase involved in cell wall biosynthesis